MAKKILIVDDDAAVRRHLKRALEQAGYTVIVAGSFQEGKEALATADPDLLVADLRLGDFNGLQLCVTSPRQIPTIIMTGFPDPVLEEEARTLGAGFIAKPFSTSALLTLIEEKLDGVERGRPYTPSRRWTRQPVTGGLRAEVQKTPARILDISYGGVRLEIERAAREIPASFNVTVPTSDLSVQVDLVWKSRTDDRWLCGAIVSDPNRMVTQAWCGLVDSISKGTSGPAGGAKSA